MNYKNAGDDLYSRLANGIILQAVKDYRGARRKLRKQPRSEKAKLMVSDCERFFCSGWFEALTEVDGRMLLRKLQEEQA